MSEYTLHIQQTLKPISDAATNFLKHPATSLSNGAESISKTTSNIFSSISETMSNLMDSINFLKHRAVNTVSTIRQTAHGAVDGMLIGAGVGFVLAGPFGIGTGAWVGTAAGAVYGFSEATDNAAFPQGNHTAL